MIFFTIIVFLALFLDIEKAERDDLLEELEDSIYEIISFTFRKKSSKLKKRNLDDNENHWL